MFAVRGTSSFSQVAGAPYKPSGHQFQSPASCNNAGPTTIRTTVASINTATASVKPSIWTTRKPPRVNAVKTAIMIAAALVISPAVAPGPRPLPLSPIDAPPLFEDSGNQEDFIVHA